MDYNQMQMTIETIKRMKNRGVFINYIEYIDFPFYKNLIPRTRINFEFPMTVLIGKNGSGKSSTLHALFGAPQGYTCSDFWFSTDVRSYEQRAGIEIVIFMDILKIRIVILKRL